MDRPAHPPNVPGLATVFFCLCSYWGSLLTADSTIRFQPPLLRTGPRSDLPDEPSATSGTDLPEPSGVFRRLGDRLEFQGDSIHAVALPSRLGPVVEHVAEMTAAAPAMHFRSWNDQAVIVRGADGVLDRREKARPASAAVEFGFGAKERQIASRTSEQTGAMLVIERAGIWPLRPALLQHLELFGGQDPLPFRLRL